MTAPQPTSPVHEQAVRIERILDLVAPKLELVEEDLRRNFTSQIRTIHDIGEHILAGGGKRLRPALLLLVSKLLRYEGLRDVNFGAVVEFIHTASLIHDDIIDEADVRRGRTSINYGWGNNMTVLVGDYLYTKAMSMIVADGSSEVLRLLLDVTMQMNEGEILGIEQNGRADLSIDEYFAVVNRKTAALFGACCRIPAYLVDLPSPQADQLSDYGTNLGICFQLVDDVLDFTSSTEVLGKPTLSDLKEGKVTLPLILAMPRASASERAVISQVAANKSFDGTDPLEIVEIVRKYDALEETRAIARDYANRAGRAITSFPASPTRDALAFALEFVLDRDR